VGAFVFDLDAGIGIPPAGIQCPPPLGKQKKMGEPCNVIWVSWSGLLLLASEITSTTGDQIDDQDDQGYDQQQVNQAAGDMEAETQ